jgi:polyisoprenoid-binding protein YceI
MSLRRLFGPGLCSLPLILGLGSAQAATTAYDYDPVHSQILFSVDHNGYSRPFGRLHIAGGELLFDTQDWTRSSTQLDIDMAGVDMGDEAWNKAVRAGSLFDTATSPHAHYASSSIERTDDTHGVMHGTLTIRGISKPVDVHFQLNRNARTIYGLHTIAGFSGTATLDRTDFGMTANKDSIGHTISIWLEIEAIRKGDEPAGGASPASMPAAPATAAPSTSATETPHVPAQ